MIQARGVRGATVLDIGAGIGVIDHELMRDRRGPRGARRRLAAVARRRPVGGAATRASRPDRLRRRRLRRRSAPPSTPPISSRSIAWSAAIPTWTRSSGCRRHALARCTASCCRATARSSAGACASRTSGSGCADSRIGRSSTRMRRWTRWSREAGLRPVREERTFVWRVVLYERGTAAPDSRRVTVAVSAARHEQRSARFVVRARHVHARPPVPTGTIVPWGPTIPVPTVGRTRGPRSRGIVEVVRHSRPAPRPVLLILVYGAFLAIVGAAATAQSVLAGPISRPRH